MPPLPHPAQDNHSRGSKLRGGGSQLGHREHTGGEGWVGRSSSQTLQRPLLPERPQLSDSTAPFASGAAPEELHLAPSARDAPSLPLTPGGQGGAASLFKGLITSEHWASHHELRAQPRRSTQSHNGFPFNNRLSGVTPLRRGRGRKGVNTVRHCRVNY